MAHDTSNEALLAVPPVPQLSLDSPAGNPSESNGREAGEADPIPGQKREASAPEVETAAGIADPVQADPVGADPIQDGEGHAGTVHAGTVQAGTVQAASPQTTEASVTELPQDQGIEAWAALQTLMEAQAQELEALHRDFGEKFALDKHREAQIDRLHRELQEHKLGLLARAQRPLIQGMVRLYDSLDRLAETLGVQPQEPLTPQRVQEMLEGFQDDVEILLEDQGVHLFRVPEPVFDPHRQTVVQGIPLDDEGRAGHIARRVRPGFEMDGSVLQKERVEVFQRA